jgi:hypothetical protein
MKKDRTQSPIALAEFKLVVRRLCGRVGWPADVIMKHELLPTVAADLARALWVGLFVETPDTRILRHQLRQLRDVGQFDLA